MTGPAERLRTDIEEAIGSTGWKAEADRRQEQAMPSGSVVVTCSAAPGSGGLGRHVQEILDALGRRGQQPTCICGPDPDARRPGRARRTLRRAINASLSVPGLRLAAAQRALRHARAFDAYAAARLPAADHLIAFNGTALEQMRVARRTGDCSTTLVSATSHFQLLVRQHRLAHRQYPLEESWAPRLLKRNLEEYAGAQRIYVASDYVWGSFVDAGVSDEVLERMPLTPHPRYRPDPARRSSSTFDVVYVGTLSVVKGVPLLIDAVRALPYEDMRLLLVGGWKSSGMRRFVQTACAEDARISAAHGDPLVPLQGARLCVHPTYNDGFAYAPAEALACGVPAIVSEDTGMREMIEEGRNGLVVPTGDVGALTEAVEAAYRGELFNG